MKIKILTAGTVNKIAAGEVINRPLAVLKELVENSLDSQAKNLSITLERGGRNKISVLDDGCGMSKEDLGLAFMRHATSKLPGEDLRAINSLGFRGEALAAILSAAKVKVKSRIQGSDFAYGLSFEEGIFSSKEPQLVSFREGTKIDVWDLFVFMPNKLRFLKSEQAELIASNQMIEAFALGYPEVAFNLNHNSKNLLNFGQAETLVERLEKVMGKDFIENAIFFKEVREVGKISGYLSIPSYNRKKANKIIIFVNKRLVKDPLLHKLVKAAYNNSLPESILPSLVIFLEVSQASLEVNLHPTKDTVLFEKESLIRDLIIDSIRKALSASKSSSIFAEKFLQAFQPDLPFDFLRDQKDSDNKKLYKGDLGIAQFQIENKYIIAEKNGNLIIVDQHAAHERITLENMKQNKILGERFLVPLEFNFTHEELELIMTFDSSLSNLGIEISSKNGKLLIWSLPSLLGGFDLEAFFYDLILEPNNFQEIFTKKLDKILSKLSCYSSIRAGKKLSLDEMNAILRLIEETNLGSHCLHGRPTYLEVKITQLDKIFERQ